jgi:solute carrier family 34 (sodium-dependent phosphate cotransporter)
MTFLVQSSSVFTSALTPLVGVGIITIERAYPLTLGSNIGTTTTSLLAALATSSSRLRYTLQISLCHLFFNVIGIVLFYPIPFMRFPIPMAKFLGHTTAKYRWFSIVYLISMFLLLPVIIFGLSVAGDLAVYCTLIPFVVVLLIIAFIKFLQLKTPHLLPAALRDWKFLPLWMRSLQPLDSWISKLSCCRCQQKGDAVDSTRMSKDLESVDSHVGTKYCETITGLNNASYDE